MTDPARHEPFALLAEFDDPERLVAAAHALKEQGWARLDAFTPFPVKGLDEALGFADDRVAKATFVGGVVGAVTAFAMQAGLSLDYPLWTGGRPLIAVPSFLMITFELTVLGAVLAGIGTLLVTSRLPRFNHPAFDAERLDLSRDDRYFLAILAGPTFDRDEAGKALAALDPRSITQVPKEPGA